MRIVNETGLPGKTDVFNDDGSKITDAMSCQVNISHGVCNAIVEHGIVQMDIYALDENVMHRELMLHARRYQIPIDRWNEVSKALHSLGLSPKRDSH